MSGIKPIEKTLFDRSLRARGMSTEGIAERLNVSGGAVRRILGGFRRRGPLWTKIAALLTEEEIRLLNHVEQSPTWNMKRAPKRPRWTPEKARQLTGQFSSP